jgi:hypothetical protein
VHGRWNNIIHEQSECYTCKQYECNEYVRSALARSNTSNVYEAWSANDS